jgi:hypothetical protein
MTRAVLGGEECRPGALELLLSKRIRGYEDTATDRTSTPNLRNALYTVRPLDARGGRGMRTTAARGVKGKFRVFGSDTAECVKP